jgi:hypothetical protein
MTFLKPRIAEARTLVQSQGQRTIFLIKLLGITPRPSSNSLAIVLVPRRPKVGAELSLSGGIERSGDRVHPGGT